MVDVLVDSSFLYAQYSDNDSNHPQALAFTKSTITTPVIPDIVLPEVAFLFRREGGIPAVGAFLRNFAMSGVEPTLLLLEDIDRARTIMTTYASAQLDFVDCAVMALAERLNIQQIATFDRRDFSIVRPRHCEYLELLP